MKEKRALNLERNEGRRGKAEKIRRKKEKNEEEREKQKRIVETDRG